MRLPARLQRKRTKGWKAPEGAVYVGRGSLWGNPFKPGSMYRGIRKIEDKAHSYCLYRAEAPLNPVLVATAQQLKGKDLMCWCKLCDRHKDGLPLGEECHECERCHADILLAIANERTGTDA